MNNDDIVSKLKFIFCGDDAKRIIIRHNIHGELCVEYDAHGRSVAEASRDVRNIVNIARVPIWLTVVHGFHNGQAIKKAVADMNFYGKVKFRYSPVTNPGETIMRVI